MNASPANDNMFVTALCRWEPAIVLFVAWLVFISIPITLGRIGLSWDGLNHHIYLGWVADQHRFGRDYLAASLQAYQFPYLYWPLYKLALGGASGVTAGIVLATLHLVTVPPVWMVAKVLIPERNFTGFAFRFAAVSLAFMSAIPLKTLEATGNDFLAAAPLVWAIALILQGLGADHNGAAPNVAKLSLLSGLLAGLAVAFKLSNGPLAVLLPLLFLAFRATWSVRLKWMVINGSAIAAGFALAYAYWGYHLWLEFGNPIYPFHDAPFAYLRQLTGWSR